MAKQQTPPIVGCSSCGSVSMTKSDYWINKKNYHWMIGDFDTGIDSRGVPGQTPYIKNGYWWIGDTNTGEPANGVVDMPSPETDTDIFI